MSGQKHRSGTQEQEVEHGVDAGPMAGGQLGKEVAVPVGYGQDRHQHKGRRDGLSLGGAPSSLHSHTRPLCESGAIPPPDKLGPRFAPVNWPVPRPKSPMKALRRNAKPQVYGSRPGRVIPRHHHSII